MLRNIIGPVFNFRNCVFFLLFFWLVFQKSSSFCRENEIFENKKKKKQTKKMDQFLTLKRANLGPVFNFTAYIYISLSLSSSFSCNHLSIVELHSCLSLSGCWAPSKLGVPLHALYVLIWFSMSLALGLRYHSSQTFLICFGF